ncbi:hypothetical protein NDU88_004715 [Pleurodeles waltl]|uniref:Uncharacterized protein n=1 Tax=Pleurodeles waltl TaxID=8319 RepID=A0AAV7NKB4_PLEWA|nr:hypothetical protein NDU88_004715 [Pleurodeles waltl]
MQQDHKGDAACSGTRGGNFARGSGVHWSTLRIEEASPVSGGEQSASYPGGLGTPSPHGRTEGTVRTLAAPDGPERGVETRKAHLGAAGSEEACPVSGGERPASRPGGLRTPSSHGHTEGYASCTLGTLAGQAASWKSIRQLSPHMPRCPVEGSGAGKGLSQTEELSRSRNLEKSKISILCRL